MGTIEAKPEATKFSIENKSRVRLQNVEWKNINFGDIGSGKSSEKIVPDGNDYIRFETSEGKQYRTFSPYDCKKYTRTELIFINNTPVYNETDRQSIMLGDI